MKYETQIWLVLIVVGILKLLIILTAIALVIAVCKLFKGC